MPSGMVNRFDYREDGRKSGVDVTIGRDAANITQSRRYQLRAAGPGQRRTVFFGGSGMHSQMSDLVSESGSLVFYGQQFLDLVQVTFGDGNYRRSRPVPADAD